MIYLDGEQIKGHDIKIAWSFKLPVADLSGASSYGLKSEEGLKPCVISVKLSINKDKPEHLTELNKLVSKVDSNGNRAQYSLVNETADLLNVRTVIFTSKFDVKDDQEYDRWNIEFALLQVRSTAEKTQQRIDAKAAQNTQTQAAPAHDELINAFEQSESN